MDNENISFAAKKSNDDVNIYEDDGFFSDVPATGSLSKSQRALNKYMKTNLLYENGNDSDYFSKEGSPNDSVSKCDSESVISDESFDKKVISEPVHSNVADTVEPTRDNIEAILNNNIDDDTKKQRNDDNATEANLPNSNSRKLIHKSTGDLTGALENGENKQTIIKHRNKPVTNAQLAENRHTVHEFDDWGNRTNIYPDVYAPLPYKSPRRYVESDVNIHYRCPVRRDPLPLVPERELARQQAEHMKRLYREQRRTKYLQDLEINPLDIDAFDASIKELQDMQSRRHQDNFTPAQKNILPLNRYDEADKVAARALYPFNGQTARELSFRKGDLIHVRRQIDNNWYEGELHGRIGLFPYNYVEILKGDSAQSPKKPSVIEGRARAKFDFTAQTNLELPLKKGEIVVLTRRIDQNWWEGRHGNNTGIFPDSYVQVLQEPSQSKPEIIKNSAKPLSSPACHGQVESSARQSMGAHSYTPQLNSPALNGPPATKPLPGYTTKPTPSSLTPSDRGYGPPTAPGVDLNNTEPLYVDTNAEAVPFRAMYKYRPQNPDELELCEGDTVYVLEKCDDGWYVGSSQRTGRFGTFPGNYVERI